MPLAIVCPGCSKRYDLADEAAGKTAKCKQCGQVFKVPVPRRMSVPGPQVPAAASARSTPQPRPEPLRPPQAVSNPIGGPPSPIGKIFDELEDEAALQEQMEFAAAPRRRSRARGDARWVRPTLIVTGLLAAVGLGGFGIYWAVTSVAARFAEAGEGPAIAANPGAGGVSEGGARGTWPELPFVGDDLYPSGTSPKARPEPSVRADVVDRGKASMRKLIELFQRMGSILSTVQDVSSAQAAVPQLQALQAEGARFSADARSIQPTMAENRAIFRGLGSEFKGAMAALRREAERLSSVPGAGPGTSQMIGGLNMMGSSFEQMMAQAEKPNAPTKPYVEVFIAGVPDTGSSDLLVEQLKASTPGISSTSAWNGGQRATAARLWPVVDARTFAAGIGFGEADVSGYRIVVMNPSIDPEAVAALQARKRQEEAARAAETAAREQEQRARQEREDPTPPPGADAAEIALTKLTSSNVFKQKDALETLAQMRPDPTHVDDVVRAVEPFATGRDHFAAQEAVRVLANWRSEEGIDVLIHVIERSDDLFVRRETMKALAREKVERAAAAIAQRLNDDWPDAEQALRTLGPGAEAGVIPLLRDGNPQMRRRACEVLHDIGGKAALEAMLSLPPDPDPFVAKNASDAMESIAARLDPETVSELRKTARAPKPR